MKQERFEELVQALKKACYGTGWRCGSMSSGLVVGTTQAVTDAYAMALKHIEELEGQLEEWRDTARERSEYDP